MGWASELALDLEQRRQQNLFRQRRLVSSAQQVWVTVDNRQLLNFCSNDYLGLAADKQLSDACIAAIETYGVGAGASHLVCGHQAAHHELELALAEFTGRERALFFSTGYMANMGVIQALVGRSGEIFEDRLNHASLIDGARLSQAKLTRYHHNDVADLARRLAASSASRKLVVTDGIFSMDGDMAPLADIATLCHKFDAILMVDDAHGFGVVGENGGGCAEYFGLDQAQLPLIVGTLGKAFGTFGAFVVGSELLIQTLIQFARTYIYTTAVPPALASASLASLRIIQHAHTERAHLLELISQLREGASQLGLTLWPSDSPIQPVMLGDEQRALNWSHWLEEQGFWVTAIRPPTVPKGQARLRITLSAAHKSEWVVGLLDALGSCIERENGLTGRKTVG